LLGAQFRAEIAAFLGRAEPPFWARRIADQTGVPENKVAAELSRFSRDGLLVATSPTQWDRRKLYDHASGGSRYWDFGYEVMARAASEEALRIGISAEQALAAYFREVLEDGHASEEIGR
jgi:hypothetical protein